MADFADLKHMVMSFRVSELQVLLGFAGRNKSGRKQELLTRALQLLAKGCSTPVQIKIRELYRRRFPGKTSTPPHPVQPPSGGMVSGLNSKFNSVSNPLEYAKRMLENSPSSHSSVPVHPDVRFKRLPFYDIMGELLKPTSLVPRNSSRFQETFFVFHLTPQQAQDIAMSRDLRPNARCEYSVQVQLRFCLLETSCEQDDNFPPSICVRVNGKMAPLPNPIPTNKPGVEPKRPSRPVNITSICRISPTVSNHVNISWASEFGRGYCVSVYLVQRLTSEVLLQRLKQRGMRHPDHTRALIKEKLAHDPDSEIATTSLRVSLMCPLGKMKITIPSRASTCNHLQCFDAPTFLQMNEKKPTWTCPVCDKPTEFDNLVIDGLFTEIIKTCQEWREIQFLEDGSWQPMKPKETGNNSGGAGKAVPDVHTIGDSPKKKEEIELIDLTETDDEDDELPLATSMSNMSTCSNSSTDSISSTSSSSSGNDSVTMAGPVSTIRSPSMLAQALTHGASTSTGCVSPPCISIDTPPRPIIHTPPSLPRTPQPMTPLSSTRSPYPSPHVSPHHTASPILQPPPAHSNVNLTPSPSSYLPHLGSVEQVSDAEFDEFLNMMTGISRGIPPHPYYPHPYSYPMSLASHNSRGPEDLSMRENREVSYSTS